MAYRPVQLIRRPDYMPREHASPTYIEVALRCLRQWGFRKLAGLKEVKERPWLLGGKESHYYLEMYMKGYQIDQSVESGKRALPALKYLPDPRECDAIETEQPIRLDTRIIAPELEPIEILGTKDLSFHKRGDPHWYLNDYKTTRGNTRVKNGEWEYVKTADELKVDVQGNWYALDIMQNKHVDIVPGRWIYILTDAKKHPDAMAVDVLFTRPEVEKYSKRFFEVADLQRSLSRRYKLQPFDINSLPGNAEACDQFGGCPYRAQTGGPCSITRNLGALLMMTPPNGQPQSDIEIMLAQRRAEMGAGGTAPAPMAPPAGSVPMAPPQAPGFPGIPPGFAPQAPAPAPVPQQQQQQPTYQLGQVVNGHQWNGVQWVPYQAPQQPPPGAYAAPPAPHLPPEAYQQPPQPPAAQGPALAAPQAPQQFAPPAPPVASTDAPKKRGRKPKAENSAPGPASSFPTAFGAPSPGAPVDPDDETEDRAQWMRACTLSLCSKGLPPIGQEAPEAQRLVQFANLLWQYLGHAGA